MSTFSATICNCPSTRVQRKFSRSLSASAAHTKELATLDGSFLAIGLLTLFESACPSPYRHYHLPSLFHSSLKAFLLVLLFTLRHLSQPFPYRTQPPQNPTVQLGGSGSCLYPPRLEWIATILAHLALFAQMRRILNAWAAHCLRDNGDAYDIKWRCNPNSIAARHLLKHLHNT